MLLGATSVMIDFGDDVGQCVLGTDSSSAKSIMERREAGRIKHLHCPVLCLQERVDSGEVRTVKRKGRAQHCRHWHDGSDCTSAQETLDNVEDGMARAALELVRLEQGCECFIMRHWNANP